MDVSVVDAETVTRILMCICLERYEGSVNRFGVEDVIEASTGSRVQ